MWEEIFSVALSNGIFACMFVALLIYELKDSSNREKKYQKTIDTLANHLSSVQRIEEDVQDIKNVVVLKKRKETREDA